jgi:5'-3' exonuclease
MGVPKFFAWLIKKFKKSEMISNTKVDDIDWFMLDTNCFIHPICFKILAEENEIKKDINFKSLQNKMMNAVIEYLDKMVSYIKPKMGVYIAIDGPVPIAKMKQQRQRRFRSVHDKILFDKIKEKHKKSLSYYWNNSAISPGTKFMEKLNDKIINWCKNQKLKIIYSNSNVPGEGEHKLLEFIRENNKNIRYLTYGLDADLIFLMLSTQSDNVYLMRESDEEGKYNFVSMKETRECIKNTFNEDLDKDRTVMDFIFLCFLLGNDFLPHIYALDIAKKGIEFLVEKWKDTFDVVKQYLVNKDKQINMKFFKEFLKKLAEDEDAVLDENYSKKRYNKYLGNDEYEKEMHKIEYLQFKIEDNIGLGCNPDYRKNYYKKHFGVSNEELEEFVEKMVEHYLVGISWVSNYYYKGIADWYWYYPYDYPPFLTDIYKYLGDLNSIKFKLNKPMTPFEQLLIILPPQSDYLLPKCLSKNITNSKSSIIHLYPQDFQIDFLYKSKYYEGIPQLPPMEVKIVRYIYSKYKDEIIPEDKKRNRIENAKYFN